MFFLVVALITLAAFFSAFALWILFWSFTMASKEQSNIEILSQANISEEIG